MLPIFEGEMPRAGWRMRLRGWEGSVFTLFGWWGKNLFFVNALFCYCEGE